MSNTFEGSLTPPAGRFAIVASRFNQLVVDSLLAGAVDCLKRHGVSDPSIDVVRVPGSLEIPLAARKLADSKKYSAIICLGAIIKGDKYHYDYVASGTAQGISQVSMDTGIPVIFGVLTCNTLEQAMNRAGAKGGNKGFDAALAAIEMANLMKQI
jgi:6,7-dimethyl-8-ribityllumazine synthase